MVARITEFINSPIRARFGLGLGLGFRLGLGLD